MTALICNGFESFVLFFDAKVSSLYLPPNLFPFFISRYLFLLFPGIIVKPSIKCLVDSVHILINHPSLLFVFRQKPIPVESTVKGEFNGCIAIIKMIELWRFIINSSLQGKCDSQQKC